MTYFSITELSYFSISTHTPVRVWHSWSNFLGVGKVFQLTHPWGCDYIKIACKGTRQFQLTHPWGCDLFHSRYYFSIVISTHTPVRVWQSCFMSLAKIYEFQLTHPWGCDGMQKKETQTIKDFNSHTREGCDAAHAPPCHRNGHFNSHTREGVTRRSQT